MRIEDLDKDALTAIYMKANNLDRKNCPITTEMIFNAMRECFRLGQESVVAPEHQASDQN